MFGRENLVWEIGLCCFFFRLRSPAAFPFNVNNYLFLLIKNALLACFQKKKKEQTKDQQTEIQGLDLQPPLLQDQCQLINRIWALSYAYGTTP